MRAGGWSAVAIVSRSSFGHGCLRCCPRLGQPVRPDGRRQMLRLRAPTPLARRRALPRVRYCRGDPRRVRRQPTAPATLPLQGMRAAVRRPHRHGAGRPSPAAAGLGAVPVLHGPEPLEPLDRRCCTDPAGGAAGRAGVARRPLTCPRIPSVPFKLNQDRRQHIPRQKRKVTNWREYDAGLRQRGSLTVWFTDEAVQAWQAEPRATRGGQPDYSPLAILTALTLRAVFRLPFRQTEGLIGSVIGLLGLDLAIPDHTPLCRRAETLEVPRPRPRSDGEPLHLLVDSTGLRLCGPGEWLVEKHVTRTRRSWKKLHLGMDANTGQIVAAELTTNDVDDGSQVGPLPGQVGGPAPSFTGAGGPDREGVYSGVAARHPEAAVIVPPRSSAVPSATTET